MKRSTPPTRSLTEKPGWIKLKCLRCKVFFWSVPSQAEHTDFCSKACRNEPPLVRLMKGVKKRGECWLFRKGENKDGYGHIKIEGETLRANRASWMLHKGSIPEGMQVLHKCIGTPQCVNPEHLYLGTVKENTADRMNQGRHKVPMGEDHSAAVLTEEKVLAIKALNGLKTTSEVAEQFGVHKSTIYHIWSGNNWKHLKPVDAKEEQA